MQCKRGPGFHNCVCAKADSFEELMTAKALGSSASITVTDQCKAKQENCKATVDKINCPTSEPQPLNFKFDGFAKALEDLDSANVQIPAKLGPIKVLDKQLS